jgi:N utilization substance protein B
MIRREVREKAFMFLFQIELQHGDEDLQLENFVAEYEISDEASKYMFRLINGVREHHQDLDSKYIPFLKGWTKERLPKVDLTILRLAVYEMIYEPEVPHNVAISEAVLLTKKFSTEESRSYVNAVLGKVSRSLTEPADDQNQKIEIKVDSDE